MSPPAGASFDRGFVMQGIGALPALAALHGGSAIVENMLDPSQLGSDRIRPLRRVEYDRLVDLGLFENERIELLRGVLVEMSPQGAAHSWVIAQLHRIFVTALGDRAQVRSQAPFALSEDSEPEPDLSLVPADSGPHEHPSRTFLLIEVAASSIPKDRTLKAALYAEAGVEEYWIVNLRDRCVEVFRQPRDGAYGSVSRAEPGDSLHPDAFSDVAVEVARILPG